ncbi:MAG: hypothetical protein ACMG51_06840 [Ginsengibacter sp.]
MSESVVALNDNVLIEFYEAAAVSSGGIIIPDSVQQKPDKGVIIAVGNTVKDPNIKVGNVVFAVKGCSTKNPVEVDGKVFNLVKDYDLLMITN